MNKYINLGVLRASARKKPQDNVHCFQVLFSPNLLDAVKDIPNFVPAAKYLSGPPIPGEVGKVERFRFIEHKMMSDNTWTMQPEYQERRA